MFRDHLAPFWRGTTGTVLLAVIGTLLVALGAQLTIPAGAVPATMQTAAVFFVAASLGTDVGGLAATLYLLAAWLGAPVLADFTHFGTTGLWNAKSAGYVIAFVPTSLALGHVAQCGWLRPAWRAFVAILIAHTLVLAVGWAWLARQIGTANAWDHGVTPFWIGALVKSGLVTGGLVAMRARRR